MMKKQLLAIICLLVAAVAAAALMTGCLRSTGRIASVGDLMSIGVVTLGNAGVPATYGDFVSAGNYLLTSAGNVVFSTAGNAAATPGNAGYGVSAMPTAVPVNVASAGNALRANAISSAAINALTGIEKLLGKTDCHTSVGEDGSMTLRFTYGDVEYCFFAQKDGNEAQFVGEEKTWMVKKDVTLGARGYLLCVNEDDGVAYMADPDAAAEYVITAGKGVTEASLAEVADMLLPIK